jgi:hypothetical protein
LGLLGARAGGIWQDQFTDKLIAQHGLQWLTGPIKRSAEIGNDPRAIVSMFTSLPDDWIALLKGACQALRVIEEFRAAKSKLPEDNDTQVPIGHFGVRWGGVTRQSQCLR